ncbi:MAG: hypothetical protein EWV50_09635 [Microcystis aeruginosa Ma_MB_F_20061100_S20]|nr:MAG: hypothetical protein EWV50_09635 [Microcystis aeruginosa Ma_MB_F_20061100_S20]
MLSLCNSASAIITVDTSLVHIASALNKPVVAIYKDCNWQINAWGPRSDVFELIRSNNSLSIRGFSIDEVVSKVQKVLATSNSHSA